MLKAASLKSRLKELKNEKYRVLITEQKKKQKIQPDKRFCYITFIYCHCHNSSSNSSNCSVVGSSQFLFFGGGYFIILKW